jgi:glycosyltransferase involved in cell wall biosynthesis
MWGGSNVALFNIIQLMQEKGHECFVITDSEYGPLLDKLDQIHCVYYQHKLRLNIYPIVKGSFKWIRFVKRSFGSLLKFYSQNKFAFQVIEKIHPDIVHTNVGPLNIAVGTCRKLGIPHVWHMREYQDMDFGMHYFPAKVFFYKSIHSKGNYNIAITKGIFNYHHLRPQDIVIYDGVFSQNMLSNKNSESIEKENYILFVGRIDEAKAPLDLLHVFPVFLKKYPQYKLLLAGSFKEGSLYKQTCDDFIKESGLQYAVNFLGEREDVYQLMSKAKALVVTSRFEGFGFITTEAMLNNCVVIGRDTGGTKEQFDIGELEAGEPIAYRFTNQAELLQCLMAAVNEDTTRMRMMALRVVSDYYTIESHVKHLEHYYQYVIDDFKKENDL